MSISFSLPVLDETITQFFCSALGTKSFPFSWEPNKAMLQENASINMNLNDGSSIIKGKHMTHDETSAHLNVSKLVTWHIMYQGLSRAFASWIAAVFVAITPAESLIRAASYITQKQIRDRKGVPLKFVHRSFLILYCSKLHYWSKVVCVLYVWKQGVKIYIPVQGLLWTQCWYHLQLLLPHFPFLSHVGLQKVAWIPCWHRRIRNPILLFSCLCYKTPGQLLRHTSTGWSTLVWSYQTAEQSKGTEFILSMWIHDWITLTN